MSFPGNSDFHGQSDQQKVKVVAGYALQQRLGSGSFATVYKGVKLPPQSGDSSSGGLDMSSQPDTVAIKAIARTSEKLTKKVLQNLEIEISILRTYRHPNIVCMHNVQKTERHFYLVLEYCGGGDVQRLIRTRKAGRLSERLTRRLMRDLSSGLKFLWGQELIHRDIKPQNLLLTGALPLDEINDPDNTPEEEARRKQINYPSEQFKLKIADFGFARHLQTASLAETLCGSPLYMAPEILQHNRYDAKADLWSVGTVLFEMIVGRPPFNGENHIDLLRNIQRKAVRLPPNVRVSEPGVNLLRLLLNRHPTSRAGFKEFFDACDAFVALGCEGVASKEIGTCKIPSNDLGTIPENESGSESLMTVATASQGTSQQQQQQQQQLTAKNPTQSSPKTYNVVSPPMNPVPAPFAAVSYQASYQAQEDRQNALTRNYPNRLAPLTQSPPSSAQVFHPNQRAPTMPSINTGTPKQQWQQQHSSDLTTHANRRNDMSQSNASTDDSGFVMVEHGANSRCDPFDHSLNVIGRSGGAPQYYVNNPVPPISGKTEYNMGVRRSNSKGMLSTSPGTGGLLMGLVTRARLGQAASPNAQQSVADEMANATKMVATAEDVGRRAVSVAHLGDSRAYLGMKLVHMNEGGSSLLSATPMEGVEEEPQEQAEAGLAGDYNSSEILGPGRRRSSVSIDKSMTDARIEQSEEMPFAVSPEAPAVSLPSRASNSMYNKGSSITSMKKAMAKPDTNTIRSHFGEALSCYLKSLKMLKGAVGAAQKVAKDLDGLVAKAGRIPVDADLTKLQKRCEVTSSWLSKQFHGVLQRADAANVEIGKLPQNPDGKEAPPVTSVEELIYNHALASGRDGAVKQLLGQFDAARCCYRSAGLLAETLLMEANIGAEDKSILESYVDGFAARITELDQLMVQQSRMTGSANTTPSNRGSSVVGLVGPPPGPSGFPLASPR